MGWTKRSRLCVQQLFNILLESPKILKIKRFKTASGRKQKARERPRKVGAQCLYGFINNPIIMAEKGMVGHKIIVDQLTDNRQVHRNPHPDGGSVPALSLKCIA